MTLEDALLIGIATLSTVCAALFVALQRSWSSRFGESETSGRKLRMILRDTTEAIQQQTGAVKEMSRVLDILTRQIDKK